MTFFVPGSSPRSMQTTRRPASASRYAAAVPARPAPTTTTSNRSPLLTCLAITRSVLKLVELRRQGGDDLEHVTDDRVIGGLEDLGLRVGVDRNDDVRFLHANQVLDCARNAASDVDAG